MKEPFSGRSYLGDGRTDERDLLRLSYEFRIWLVAGISGTKFYKEGRLSQPVPKFYFQGCEITKMPLNGIKVRKFGIGFT